MLFLLIALILGTVLPAAADSNTVSGTWGENIRWELDQNTGKLVISGEGDMEAFYPDIPKAWHEYQNSIKSVVIENGVTSIGEYAFYNCNSLTSVTIGNSVTSIGRSAFLYCIGLTSITIPDSVTSVGKYAFEICISLTNVTIGNSVTSIGNSAFYGCGDLSSIAVDSENKYYHSNGNCLIETESKTLILGCKNSVLPTDGSIKRIGNFAFNDCHKLTSLTIPDSVTAIGEYAFSYCSGLTKITIPDSVTSIENNAFSHCINLKSVTIGKNVTSIGAFAFDSCGRLTDITIPEKVTSIGDHAFGACVSLKSIAVDSKNSKYHSKGNCLIETNSKTLVLGCQVSVIPTDGSVTAIGYRAFSFCEKLESITIPDSVISIGEYAFYGCISLKSITVSDSLTRIGANAFSFCTSLRKIIYCGTQNQWQSLSKDTTWDMETGTYTVSYHQFNGGTVTAQPTHLTKGEKTFTCSVCGEIKTESIAKLTAHTWNTGVITAEPSHTEYGTKTYTCACGEVKTEKIEKTAEHSYGEWKNHTNMQHKKTCACGSEEFAEHIWNEGTLAVAPTHLAFGRKNYTCECGATKTEPVEKTAEHTCSTYVNQNLTSHKGICACGEEIVEQHNWNEGEVAQEPTQKKEGSKVYTCPDCGTTKTEAINKLSNSGLRLCQGRHNAPDAHRRRRCGYRLPRSFALQTLQISQEIQEVFVTVQSMHSANLKTMCSNG